MEVDPLTGRSFEGAPYGGAGTRPSQEELDREFARSALMANRPSAMQQYEQWGEQHPVARFGVEAGGDLLLNTLGPAWLKRLPGTLGTMGTIWEQINKYGQEGWAGGAQIDKPRLKAGPSKRTHRDENKFNVDITERKTGNYYGSATYTLTKNPDDGKPMLYLDFAGGKGDDPGTGQLMHVGREVLDRHPEIEWVKFYRSSGAGPRNKRRHEYVTMPAELIRRQGKRKQGSEEPAMFAKSIEEQSKKGVGRIKREPWGTLPNQEALDTDFSQEAADIGIVNELGIDPNLPDAQWEQAVRQGLRREWNYSDRDIDSTLEAARDHRTTMRQFVERARSNVIDEPQAVVADAQLQQEILGSPVIQARRRQDLQEVYPDRSPEEIDSLARNTEEQLVAGFGDIPYPELDAFSAMPIELGANWRNTERGRERFIERLVLQAQGDHAHTLQEQSIAMWPGSGARQRDAQIQYAIESMVGEAYERTMGHSMPDSLWLQVRERRWGR